MRCQKARSCLSAYCREELTGRDLLAMREHLAGCALCRREEAAVRAMFTATGSMKGPSVSADFNAKLLERIARERFSETRTKAYIPRRTPVFGWGRLVPVAAVVALAVLAFVGSEYLQRDNMSPVGAGQQASLDNSYLTVQPERNREVTTSVNSDWSFRSQFVQAERVNRVSGMLTNAAGFADPEPRIIVHFIVPYNDGRPDLSGLQIRPVLRTYEPTGAVQAKETRSVY